MSKYDKLDAAILTGILAGKKHGIHMSRDLCDLARELSGDELCNAWRIVDGRLQSLRRAGHIRYGGQKVGWLVVEAKESA